VGFGDLISTDKYSGHVASVIANWFVDEVNVPNLVAAMQAQLHSVGDDPFAGRVNLIEEFVIALSFQIREHLPDAVADKISPLRDIQVGIVHIFIHVLRSSQHRDETWHLGEQLSLSVALRGDSAISQHPFRRLNDNGYNAGRPTVFIEHRRVIQIHPDLLGPSTAMEDQFLVLVGQRTARQPNSHDILIEGGDFRPAIPHFST
jgi:hypothetical protein